AKGAQGVELPTPFGAAAARGREQYLAITSENDMAIANGSQSPDVVVIGGGPAGSTVSTLLAQHGLRVRLFERERFPRFHIGESLIPETYWVFRRLKMLDKMKASPFVKKYSVQFINAAGKLSAPF